MDIDIDRDMFLLPCLYTISNEIDIRLISLYTISNGIDMNYLGALVSLVTCGTINAIDSRHALSTLKNINVFQCQHYFIYSNVSILLHVFECQHYCTLGSHDTRDPRLTFKPIQPILAIFTVFAPRTLVSSGTRISVGCVGTRMTIDATISRRPTMTLRR